MNLEELAIEAWMEYSVTEVFESRHWYEIAKDQFIEEYIQTHSIKQVKE